MILKEREQREHDTADKKKSKSIRNTRTGETMKRGIKEKGTVHVEAEERELVEDQRRVEHCKEKFTKYCTLSVL